MKKFLLMSLIAVILVGCSTRSTQGGYTIGIQHDKNIISVYKHNAALLHQEGDIVNTGDPIAIIGKGGSTSTGTHLHFELWFKGMPLNPEDYISFE